MRDREVSIKFNQTLIIKINGPSYERPFLSKYNYSEKKIGQNDTQKIFRYTVVVMMLLFLSSHVYPCENKILPVVLQRKL